MSQSKFVAAVGQCDVFLDSIGWSGCNSALESLPHNLPIVTMPGALMRGRHSAAILQMMGVTETIAATVDDYVVDRRAAGERSGRAAGAAARGSRIASTRSIATAPASRRWRISSTAPRGRAARTRWAGRRRRPDATGKICRLTAETTRRGGPSGPPFVYKPLKYRHNFDGTGIATTCPRKRARAPSGGDVRADSGDEVMGLFDALTSAVSGLQAQAFAMQNISGNIANSQTIAYKGINTSFEDLIPGAAVASQQVAGGVVASSVATNTVQGAIQNATSGTYMAINGDGYFVVQAPPAFPAIRRSSAASTAIPAAAISIECRRLSGERQRLLSRRDSDRSGDRQSERQRRRSLAIPE